MELQTILIERDKYPVDSEKWNEWDYKKSLALENEKPHLNEEIVAFKESDLMMIPKGISTNLDVLDIKTPYISARRSRLEYHPLFRQLIPFALITYQGKIYATQRTTKGGESRLHGKVSFLGGHAGLRGEARNLHDLIRLELLRELKEEIGLQQCDIASMSLMALIKEDGDVEEDHLGVVYHIELTHDQITVVEKDKLIGQWYELSELLNDEDNLETWAKLIIQLFTSNQAVTNIK